MIHFLKDGPQHICVQTGMPEHPLLIGVGHTSSEAFGDLAATPIQSAGHSPAASALRWARNEGWISSDVETLEWL